MAKYEEAIPFVLTGEGGWNLIKGDKGGETYEGIARNDYPNWPGWIKIDNWKSVNGKPLHSYVFTDEKIPGLQQDVLDFYKENFWDLILGDQINDQKFATYLLDWFVNSKTKAVEKLQELVGISFTTGHFGQTTLDKVNIAGSSLLFNYHQRRIKYYHDHVKAVSQDEKFLSGWINRCINLYQKLS